MEQAPRNILVIKLGALGDFIQALGPMAAIRKHHAGDRITLLTTPPYEDLARACPYADHVVTDARPRWHDVKGWLSLRRFLNEGNFARVYDLQNNDRTAFYLHLFSPRPEWVGAAKGASHRNDSPDRTAGRAFDGHVHTLKAGGVWPVKPDTLGWMQGTAPPLPAPYALLVCGASPRHPEKRWPAESYAAFAARLIQNGVTPVLIGGESEAETLAAVERDTPGCINLCGRTDLFDIAALARGAFGAVGNDTGPMHLIAPTGCPSIVLFSGKTNPKKHAPIGHNVLSIQKNDLGALTVDAVWDAFRAQHMSV